MLPCQIGGVKIDKFIYNTSDVCEFFSISRKTLTVWEKKGAPKEARGQWDIKKLMEWKYQNQETSPEVRKTTAEANLKETKAAQEKIKLALTEERYIDTKETSNHLKRLFAVLKQSLLSLGYKIGDELNSIDPDMAIEAKKIIDDEVYAALEDLSKGKELYGGKAGRNKIS